MKWLNCAKIRLVLVGFVAAIVLSGPAKAATITVGSGAGYDFDSIQAGIDDASDGDTVLVVPGEYIITEPIVFKGKAITVMSEAGPDETTIRMSTPADTNRGSVVIFENGETTASVLEGFTITGGTGFWFPSESAWGGGGIAFNGSSGTVRNCAIVQNCVEDSGGGVGCVYPCSPILIDCTIVENSAGDAGGGVLVYSGSSITLTNCIIDRNSATGFGGGGVSALSGASAILTNCFIRDNSATGRVYATGLGGGVTCYDNSPITMTGCAIIGNSAQAAGGVLSLENPSPVTMTRCLIVGNKADWAGGLASWTQASIAVTNCTIWDNEGGHNGGGVACYDGASATVTNSILWGNTAAEGQEIFLQEDQNPANVCNVTYSNVAGGQAGVTVKGGSTLIWGDGNIEADPCFADPNNHDFHLKSVAGRWDPNSQTWVQDDVTSPCIDIGDPMNPIGLEPFPNGGFVNMGAYGGTPEASKTYFGEPICETIVAGDINGDCQVDLADLAIMALHWTDDEPMPQ